MPLVCVWQVCLQAVVCAQNSTLLLKVMLVFSQTFCKLDIFLIISFGVINMDLLSVKVVLQENLHVFN